MAQHIFVTGGARGIGAAIVSAFARAGYRVSFSYLKSHEKAVALSAATGALAICADGCDEQAVSAAVARAGEENGPVYALINCAGISSFELFQEVTTAQWDKTVNTNLRAAFFYIRALLPDMIARQNGVILNISSVWGMVGSSCEVLYSTTKAALIGMTKALAKEVAPSGIRVNCIAPGVIDTDMNAALGLGALDALAEETPLGRIGTPEEVARLALYLVRDDTFLVGQVLSPNGGFVI